MIKTLPVLLLKKLVLLPNQEVKVELNNDISREVVMEAGKIFSSEVLVVSPKDALEEIPEVSDLPEIGVIGRIESKIELPNGHLRVKLLGLKRVHVKNYFNEDKKDVLKCLTEEIDLPKVNEAEEIAITRKLQKELKKYIKLNPTVPNTIVGLIKNKPLSEITDLVASFIPLTIDKKLFYMEELNYLKRGYALINDLNIELEVIELNEKINENLQKGLDESQKEFILREKIKEIQKELGEASEEKLEVTLWNEQLNKLTLDNKTVTKIKREILKYEKMNDMSPDASFVRNYLDSFFALPWSKFSYDETDLNKIEMTLNKTHYGLEEVKKRVLEYVAVKKRNPNLRSPIICLVGPPGVGKTTIAMSIAAALNKEFYKISVGGLNDASELVGHRRTYIGSSPGKIMEAMMKCATNNPVLLIDEVDKMTKNYHGDPASALLDALDYPQNTSFVDNYIEEPFDLSHVLFILTANSIGDIPTELKDRLEIIEVNSYTLYEKINLAKTYLLPEIYKDYNVMKDEITIPDGVISKIVIHYTKEAGVRELKRKLETLVRKIITSFIKAHRKLEISLEEKDVRKYLDNYIYDEEVLPKLVTPGLALGLAWTSYGGKVITIEACIYDGSGKIVATGSLEKVMEESISVSLDYIKSHYKELEINDNNFINKDIHLHALDGQTPKDGPSAGVAITTSLLSIFYNRSVAKNIAMTGEMTLRGEILPVGGIKEKLIGAFNANIQTVYLPKQNKKDLKKVPSYVTDNLNIVLVSNYKEIHKDLFS